jgi:Uma2 family endonuclease
MSTVTVVTADQLLHMPEDGYRYELVAGELKRMPPAGCEHGAVGGDLQGLLFHHVRQHRLGKVFSAETGFLLARDPDTVLAPDVAFVCADRLREKPITKSFWPGAPDLVVEVVSPGDTIREIDDKAKAWLAGGARMVWVVNPAWRSVAVYRAEHDIRTLAENDDLTGEDVVPGFSCRVVEIFADV